MPSLGLTIQYPIKTDHKIIGTDLTFRLNLTIINDAILAKCKTNVFDYESHWRPLHQVVREIIKSTINILTFSTGYMVSPLVEYIILPDQTTKPIKMQFSILEPMSKSIDTSAFSQRQSLQYVLEDLRLAKALRDLVEAVDAPRDAFINCARAIEGLRHCIAGDVGRETAWVTFREVLNLTKEYLQVIMEASREPRHGGGDFYSHFETTEVLRRSWVIMDRYFEFLKRGRTNLSIEEFPLLL